MRSKDHTIREPLFRMVERDDMTKGRIARVRTISILLAVIAGSLLFVILGKNPLKAYADMFYGAFGTAVRKSRCLQL